MTHPCPRLSLEVVPGYLPTVCSLSVSLCFLGPFQGGVYKGEKKREFCQKVIACSRPMLVPSFLLQPRIAEISSKGLDPSSLLLLSPQFPSPLEMQATF